MNQMAFMWAAYVITLGGTAALTIWAWASMGAAEKAAQR
jgi:hypothetical protein